jgi:hypothetical protein
MLLYGCFDIDIVGPLTQYLKTFPKFSRGAELQPLRTSRTLSFPQTRCFGVGSFNANEEEGGMAKEEVGGVALSSLRPWYHALCLQWMSHNGEAHKAFGRVL